MGTLAIIGLVSLAILLITLYVVCGFGTYLLVESVVGDTEKYQNDLDAPARCIVGME
jgi:hypothetical protein